MAKIYCDLRRCVGCKTCELACRVEHSNDKSLELAIYQTPKPKKRVRIDKSDKGPFAIRCQHCEDAPCVPACMSGAMYKDKKTGQAKHDKDKCVGCWMCVMVCPFGAIVMDIEDKNAVKCDMCPDRERPACVETCPVKALFIGEEKDFKKMLEEFSAKRDKI